MNGNNSASGRDQISSFDLKIIDILQKHGRMPFAKIAQELGVSTGMVRQHYQKLVDRGILQVAAITNPMLMGQSKMAMIGIKADGQRLREIAEEVSSFDEVIYLILVTGSYDLIAEVVCSDKNHLLDFLTNKLYKVEGIRDSKTFMFLEIIKEEYTYDLNSQLHS